MTKRDYYDILGVEKNATKEEIRKLNSQQQELQEQNTNLQTQLTQSNTQYQEELREQEQRRFQCF